jgi:transcriptional regulator with XRE-family HTH domain
MTTNRTGQRIQALREDRGWTYSRMVREVLNHDDLGVEYAISESTIRRAEDGGLLTTRTRYAIALVLGERPSSLWPPTVLANRPRRSASPKEIAA